MTELGLAGFGTILLAAVLIETIINIIQNIEERNTSWKYWLSLVLGILLSVLVAINWDIDLFKMAGLSDGRFPVVGAVLTGLILSRGSNVVSDLIGLVNKRRPTV